MPNNVKVELQLGGTWTDITTYTYVRGGIKIKRGRSDEGKNIDPSTCDLQLNNKDGRFSPRNPTGPYYGLLQRNTPLRVSVLDKDDVSAQQGATGVVASTPHNTAFNATGTIDLRAEVLAYDWYRSGNIIGKWNFATQNSYLLWTDGTGALAFSWSTLGTNTLNTYSTARLPRGSNRRMAVRVSFVIATGTATFYYADSITGTWLQLGDPVVSGATSIFAGNATFQLGQGTTFLGRYYKAEVRTGAGTPALVASPDFTAQTAGATSFTDAQARLWTIGGTASLTTANVRFVGEVSQWPVKWDYGEDDVYVPVQASGILRRLNANSSPLRSAIRRSIPSLANLKAYWPMEDASGSTSLAFGLSDTTGQYGMSISKAPSLSAYSGFAASDPIPTFGSGAYAKGKVPPYTGTSALQVRFLMYIPSGGAPAVETTLCYVQTTGSTWKLNYTVGGGLKLIADDLDSSGGTTIGPIAFGVDGKLLRVSIELQQSGANVTANMLTLQVGTSSGLVFGGTATNTTLGRATSVQVGAPGASSSLAIGHVTVENGITSLYDLATQLTGYNGEKAATRASRLAGEEGYALYVQGSAADSAAMGPQTSAGLLDLLRQCQDADLGILTELRGVAALGFRTRVGMEAVGDALKLNYAAQQLHDFEPVEDDQTVANDYIVTRVNGSSYQVSQTTGTLGINTVGRYQETKTVALASDAQLRDHAGYRLALGTVDEPRYPQVGVKLHAAALASDLALTRACLDADVGDVMCVINPPSFYAPFTAFQRIEGYTEVIGSHTYDLTWNTSPGVIWRGVGLYNDPTNRTRYDARSSTLAAGATSSATTLSVATSADSEQWTTAPADLPFQVVIAGEVMTVTAVSGTTSPQTFTVTRSVNGVSKAQLAGAEVHVYPVAYYTY